MAKRTAAAVDYLAAMELRQESVYVETDRHVIEGTLTLPSEGYRSRMTDFINARDRDFLVLTDADVKPINDPGPGTQRDWIAISLRHLVLIW